MKDATAWLAHTESDLLLADKRFRPRAWTRAVSREPRLLSARQPRAGSIKHLTPHPRQVALDDHSTHRSVPVVEQTTPDNGPVALNEHPGEREPAAVVPQSAAEIVHAASDRHARDATAPAFNVEDTTLSSAADRQPKGARAGNRDGGRVSHE